MATRKIRAPRMPKAGPVANAEVQAARKSAVIYVHGVGQRDSKEDLCLQWDLALFGRDLGDRSRMAYWGDLRADLGTRPAARTSFGDAIDLGPILRELPEPREVSRELWSGLLRQIGVLDDDEARAERGIFHLPAGLRHPRSREFIESLVSESALYFFNEIAREVAKDRLVSALMAEISRPVTIVAHGLGSIIAYEVLSQWNGPDIDLDAFVTLGSPLGIPELQARLLPNDLSMPAIVKRWQNFSDPADLVADSKGLAPFFDVTESVLDDELIVSSQSRRLWGFNPHSAVGYLAHPSVRRVVNDAMRRDVLSRFVLARDVAERLGADATERHPVLVEVLEPGYRAIDEDFEEMRRAETSEVEALPRKSASGSLRLEDRIERAAQALRGIVSDEEAACIDPLRRFVAARLTANELREVGAAHRDMRIYAVWQSSRKTKLTHRSMRVLKADAALTSFGADGRDITWAVLDTGIRADHPHFKGVVTSVWDCTKRGRPVLMKNAQDDDGHGTHVAGIISGKAADGKQRGVAPLTRLVVYKVLDNKGRGQDAWIIKALDHIAEQNENITGGLAIHGLNLSLGGPFDNTVYGCGFSPICAELRRLWRGGVLVVVACGNEGLMQIQTPDGDTEINTAMSIGDPANLDDCIAVGSVNADRPHLYGVSSFSSRGPTADGRAKPDVVAPGERIRSCNARYRTASDQYYEESGTSMAAPHVSGLLAAFLSVRREFRGRPDEVKKVLLDSCIDLGRDRYHQGKGIPNLMQMLLSV